MIWYNQSINTLRSISAQYIRDKKPLGVALLLGLSILAAHFVFTDKPSGEAVGVLGGPRESTSREDDTRTGLLSSLPLVTGSRLDDASSPELLRLAVLHGTLKAPGNPLGLTSGQGTVLSYRVKKGDTISKIAADFGVSVQTIIGSNPEVKNRSLQVGQELNILPVSGSTYKVKEGGETAESIAASFHLSVLQLKEVNRSIDFTKLKPGDSIVIPGTGAALSANDENVVNTKALPDLAHYFIRPTEGFNWGRIHAHNAVDIANSCGVPVIAAAEGLVIDLSTEGWSSGYGHFVFIEHPNGTKTRYAHLDKVAVSVGDYVKQGQALGTMGQTGESTGCHLHFEVYEAKNPFAKS